MRIAGDLDYTEVYGLSMEERRTLEAVRPENIGQARRVEGVTPSGCIHLLHYVARRARTKAKAVVAEEERKRREVLEVTKEKGLGDVVIEA